jgi:hypothetical protein
MSDRLDQYITLISSFVTDKITATDFEREYLKLFKADETEWPEAEFAILDELFGEVDAFCADPQLRDENDLDEYELKERCKVALERLQSVVFANS